MIQKTKNTKISAETIVEPTGVDIRIDANIPTAAQMTDIIAEQIITPRKLLNTLIAESDGKIIRADMSSEPTKFIASTIISAVTTAIRRLYPSAFMPVAFEKFSSNVTANILL